MYMLLFLLKLENMNIYVFHDVAKGPYFGKHRRYVLIVAYIKML